LRYQLTLDLVNRADHIDVMLPDDLLDPDSDRTIEYIIDVPRSRSQNASQRIFTVEMAARLVDPSDQESLDTNLRFLDGDRNEVARSPLIDCLADEFELSGDRFLLCDGVFWRVERPFLDQVNAELSAARTWTVALPDYQGGDEGIWNKGTATVLADEMVLLDQKLITLEGETPFEACDLIHRSGAMVHAKRKGRSSTMNHLFAQLERSCRLLVQVPDARSRLRSRVIEAADGQPELTHHILKSLDALDQRAPNLDVVLALLGDWHHRTLKNLPLLAKIGLAESFRRVDQMGFRPAVALISLPGRPAGSPADYLGTAGRLNAVVIVPPRR
jgi:uncharacterized protein (TIGR04141 family)